MLSQQPSDIDLNPSSSSPHPKPNALARRSVSIFSRRGHVESIDYSDLPTMKGLSFISGQKQSAQRSKSTPKLKRNSKGTVLNAVPLSGSQPQLSPAVFATSAKPSSPLDFACATASHEATTLKERQTSFIAERRPRHGPSKSSVERIGVWVDGIVHWDGVHTRSPELGYDIHKHIRAVSAESGHRLRPSLTVIIPGGKLLTREQSIAALRRPATRDGSMRSVRRETSSSSLDRDFAARIRKMAHESQSSVTKDVSPVDPFQHGSSKAGTIFSPMDSSRAGSSASNRHDPSRSSSNASSAPKDDVSYYSKHSSNTSIDGRPIKKASRHKMSASAAFSIVNPTVAATLEEYTPITRTYVDKPLPTPPARVTFTRTPPLPPMPLNLPTMLPSTAGHTPTAARRPQTSRGTKSPRPGMLHKAQSFQSPPSALRNTQSMDKFDRFDKEFMKSSPWTAEDDMILEDSPTLSQVEAILHEHLGRISPPVPPTISQEQDTSGLGITLHSADDAVNDMDERESISHVMQPPSRAPTIPRKSRKRDWSQSTSGGESAVELLAPPITRRSSDPSLLSPQVDDAPPADWWIKNRLSRSVSCANLPKLNGFAEFIARDSKELVVSIPVDDGLIVVSGPQIMHRRQKSNPATQKSAENVLVKILASLTSIDDLINTMRINKGMYRVYKENQQRLVRTVGHNESAAAAEFREWAQTSTSSEDDDTEELIFEQPAALYLQTWQRDQAVIEKLKTVIVCDCQSILRKETVAAMANKAHPQAQRVTDAFWRIWTFCTIFGGQKGRDEDFTGQLDWLKGGRLANNLDCAATVSGTNFDFDACSILLDAPDYFGKGNNAGLTAEQLYDVTEIWTCMATLLQGYLGRIDQARNYGVYDNCDIEEDDIEKEEHMIEEWIAFILTLGPLVVLELAEHASDPSPAGFALAKNKGWTKWTPPTRTASRVTFLKEPVARLYEERVTAANTKPVDSREQTKKEEFRKRIAAHALEIKMRRQDSAFKRVPLVDMSMERPMSILSTLSGGPALTPRFPPKEMTLPPLPKPKSIHPALRTEDVISPGSAATLQQSLLSPPLTGQFPSASVSPRIVPAVTLTQHQARNPQREALRAFNGVGIGTVELAIQRLMSMGFTEHEATHALRTTDGGDGLRVDRAAEYLFRSKTPPSKW